MLPEPSTTLRLPNLRKSLIDDSVHGRARPQCDPPGYGRGFSTPHETSLGVRLSRWPETGFWEPWLARHLTAANFPQPDFGGASVSPAKSYRCNPVSGSVQLQGRSSLSLNDRKRCYDQRGQRRHLLPWMLPSCSWATTALIGRRWLSLQKLLPAEERRHTFATK